MRLSYSLKNGTDVAVALRRSRAVAARERMPREELERHQQRRLAELVAHASTHSAFYREHYGGRLHPSEVRLEALRPVTKAMMMQRLDAFVTDSRLSADAIERHLASIGPRDDLFLGEYRVMASSGSSGRKGIYIYDRSAWRGFLDGAIRWSGMLGITPRLPIRRRLAQVAAPDSKHMTCRGAASMAIGMFKTIRLSATQPLEALVAALNRHQPDAIMGYPSVLALLAEEQLAGTLAVSPTRVCTTSEVRTAEMTDRIRAAWKQEPYDCLGLTETGITASDCAEHAGLHVFEDACIFEVVDELNRPVPPGTPGDKVLVTNLYNFTQPFIRFEVTDLVTVTDEPCGCGRTFRRIVAIEGRSDDILEVPAQRGGMVKVHPIHLRSPLAALAAVSQYQVIQCREGLDVTLALGRGAEAHATSAAVEQALGRELTRLGAAPMVIRVRVVPHIEREAGAGKFKLVKALVH